MYKTFSLRPRIEEGDTEERVMGSDLKISLAISMVISPNYCSNIPKAQTNKIN